ncbi:MAG: hypothetical protein AABZ08_03640 [Planctomycetota bacterium]
MNSALVNMMTGLAAVLGQADPMAPWEGVQKAFRNALPRAEGELSPYQMGFRFVIGLLAVVLFFYFVARFAQRERVGVRRQAPGRFFSSVLSEIGIGWLDRFLLRRIARHSSLPQPSVILFSTDLLRKYSEAWIESLAFPPIRGLVRSRIDEIEVQAFAELPGVRSAQG